MRAMVHWAVMLGMGVDEATPTEEEDAWMDLRLHRQWENGVRLVGGKPRRTPRLVRWEGDLRSLCHLDCNDEQGTREHREGSLRR